MRISKKTFITFLLSIVVLGTVGLFVFSKVGDIRPAFLPPNKELLKVENLDIPLEISGDFTMKVYAKNLGNARDLQVSPGGVLLVTTPQQGKVMALIDKEQDGVAEENRIVLEGLEWPHGIAFHNGKLFLAEQNKLSRYEWDEENLTARFEKELFSYPKGGNHITRTLAIKKDSTLYLTIGSTCNVCFEKHDWLASVVVSDVEGKNPRVFAKGLRNSVFLKLHPATEELWAADMGRDLVGDNMPPEEINIIKEGGDYGWPVCFGNGIHDANFDFEGKYKERCKTAVWPTFSMQAHSAPLGIAFIDSEQFPSSWQGDLLVAFHGSWNRSKPTGYKVVRIDLDGSRARRQHDFITGFLKGSQALGRPVDLEFDQEGALFISDDKLGVVYKLYR